MNFLIIIYLLGVLGLAGWNFYFGVRHLANRTNPAQLVIFAKVETISLFSLAALGVLTKSAALMLFSLLFVSFALFFVKMWRSLTSTTTDVTVV